MRINFTLLTVSRLIIHEVPRRVPGDKQASPILSEVESELSAEIKGMLRDRLMSAADTSPRGFDIERDPKSTSPIAGVIQSYLVKPSSSAFVAMSQSMSSHLFQNQPPISPAGLLVVMECNIGGIVAVAILKIEKEEGARLFRPVGGKMTFNLQHL